jgi:SnoaL-like domain
MLDYQAYVADFNRNDERGTVERWFTDDLVVEVPGQVITGPEPWIAFLEASHSGGVQETLTPVTVLQQGDRIMAEVDITFVAANGRPDFPLAPLAPGRPATLKFFAVYHLRDDKIARLKLAFWPEPLRST